MGKIEKKDRRWRWQRVLTPSAGLLLGITLGCVLSACGCGDNEQKIEAHKRWGNARARMNYGLAMEHLKVGRLEKAREKAYESLAQDPNFSPARVLMGTICIEQGLYRQAIRELAPLQKKEPKNAEVAYLTAVALEKDGQLESALAGYRRAHSLDKKNMSCVTAAGEVLVMLGRTKDAEQHIQPHLSRAEAEPALHELAGRLATMHGRHKEAVKHFRRAADIDYRNPCYQESLAQAQFRAGTFPDALETLGGLIRWNDREPDPTRPLGESYAAKAWVHTMMGDCHMALKRHRAAYDSYCIARQLKGANAEAWVDVAKAALAIKDAPAAVRAATEALRIDETSRQGALTLGYALLQAGQAQRAMSVLAREVARHPGDATLLCLLGRACALTGDRPAARRHYRKAVEVEPDSELARVLLAALDKPAHSATSGDRPRRKTLRTEP